MDLVFTVYKIIKQWKDFGLLFTFTKTENLLRITKEMAIKSIKKVTSYLDLYFTFTNHCRDTAV